ncbi:MAG: hypothetical protein JZU65_16150, partial [Chlorobium sp.]|nr:hypothetical protein [Chlorobium sp.]
LTWAAQGNEAEPYIEPQPPIPQSITPRQGRIMLSRAGLLDTVKELLANKTGQAGVEARIEFETAAQWERDWPLLLSASSEVGLTNAQVDQMFVDGAKL